MILSKYRNPPYRSPISKDTSIPISPRSPQHPPVTMYDSPASLRSDSEEFCISPSKRKHSALESDQDSIPSVLRSQIDSLDDDFQPHGAESPRSKVVERLRGLQICSGNSEQRYRSEDNENDRKKARRETSTSPSPRRDNDSISPSPYGQFSPPTPMPSPSPGSRPTRRRLSSPPPPVSALMRPDGESGSTQRAFGASASPPRPPAAPASSPQKPDLTANTLTWQLTEITGHRLDPRNPDDDGEGINGVGFRPTPAIALARSQRRKQQVSEWKAREAKDARQRRFERRRAGAGAGAGEPGGGSGIGRVRRTVRFAGVL